MVPTRASGDAGNSGGLPFRCHTTFRAHYFMALNVVGEMLRRGSKKPGASWVAFMLVARFLGKPTRVVSAG